MPQIPANASDESVVRALDDEERLAALNRDVPALERLWADDLIVNAPNNRVIIGRESNLNAFVRSGIINFSRYVRLDEPFALLMGSETVVPKDDAPSVGLIAGQQVRRRFTNIWRKRGSTWQLCWRHANVIRER